MDSGDDDGGDEDENDAVGREATARCDGPGEQTHAEVDLAADADDDPDDDGNCSGDSDDVVELFSMIRGNHASACSVCGDGGGECAPSRDGPTSEDGRKGACRCRTASEREERRTREEEGDGGGEAKDEVRERGATSGRTTTRRTTTIGVTITGTRTTGRGRGPATDRREGPDPARAREWTAEHPA